jgi:hypothetical protein
MFLCFVISLLKYFVYRLCFITLWFSRVSPRETRIQNSKTPAMPPAADNGDLSFHR